MWLGEKITDRGIGNGISLLITVGIIASLPLSFTQEVISQLSGSGGLLMIAIEFVIWVVVIALCILLVLAVRQIPVQYARRSAMSGQSNMFSKRQYIPLRPYAAGVMPIIFAQAIMFAPAYLYGLGALGVPDAAFVLGKGISFMIPAVIILVTGCVFAMWLGEKITDRGIGNGISLLITVGIIASLPLSFTQEVISQLSGSGGLLMIAIEFVIWVVVIALCILLVLAVRQIPVQYARRSAMSGQSNMFSKRQYIPLRPYAAGVMPIIFAQAIMFAPAYIGQFIGGTFGQWMQASFSDMFGLAYNILFGLLIILFTFFYTAITVPTNKMADDLKRSGGFVPGIKPGGETAEFLDKIMSLITFPGSIFLALLSVLPAVIVALMQIQQGWALFYGGTSLLIMVGVAIDTIQQINAYLLNRHYDSLMKTGKNRRLA
jgi:preprotein translocase subunit SecY